MGQSPAATRARGAPDLVITSALVVDSSGIYKADVGVRDGRISAIGKAGNTGIMDGVTPGLEIGASTGDPRRRRPDPDRRRDRLPRAFHLAESDSRCVSLGPHDAHRRRHRAGDRHQCDDLHAGRVEHPPHVRSGAGLPAELRLPRARATPRRAEPLREQIRAGAIGLKLHEDWGTTPAAIDQCLAVADEFDVQVAIHTDTLNEAGFVEDTIAAIDGRTIHTYHTEGAGGGHAPDIIRLCGEPNVLPSSTNPTMPFTRNTLDEHLDMLMVCHHLSPKVPEDVAFADSRIRPETIAAEDVLHDLGAISMMSSDSQAMGRIGEVICRTWQTADKMKRQRGPLPGDSAGDDNQRVRRYIAKYTINPAIAHGICVRGRIDRGREARRSRALEAGVLRRQAGADHQGRVHRRRDDGRRQRVDSDAAAGDRAIDVRRLRRRARLVQRALRQPGGPAGGCARRPVPSAGRGAATAARIGKRDLVLNDALPKIEVDADTYEVRADGELLTCEPVDVLPLAQRYFLF